MSSNATYRMKIGGAIVLFSIAAIIVATKITGTKNIESADNPISKPNVATNQDSYIYWSGLFFDLRTVTRLQHEIWQQEDAVKRLVRAGEVAIAMEKLKELKQNHSEAEDKYDRAAKAAKLADPDDFNIYEVSITNWKYEVNAAHLKYRLARSSEELRITHTEYLDKLYKSEIELPEDF
jgi:hypothetical protein